MELYKTMRGMKMNKITVFMIGAGGHAKVLLDCLKLNEQVTVLGMLDLHHEDEIKKYSPSEIKLINGVGSIGVTDKRKNIFAKFKAAGFHFLNVMHPTAYVGQDVVLGEGVQVITRSTIQPGCRIGNNVIINTHAAIDHDCKIGDHVHLAPGVICSGGVTIGSGTHVGSGAIILQGIQIGDNCLIAAGAVVTRDVDSASRVAGVPAKAIESRNSRGNRK